MKEKNKVVITYGTFDNFHIGHLKLIQRAKDLGDKLIVCVSTDEFNEIKNKRCIYPYDIRSEIVKGLKCVDEVIPETNWDQKINDIKNNNVDLFVMGDDWKGHFDFLKEYCEVVYLPRTEGISTSILKDKFSGDKFLGNGERPEKFVSEGTGLIDHYIYRPIVIFLVKKGFLKIFSPNFLTTLGLLFSLFASYLIFNGNIYLGLFLYIFFPLIDLMDGAVARYYRKTSSVGAFYDGLVDTFSEIIILLSVGYYFDKLNLFLIMILFVSFIQIFSYRMNWVFEIKERQINFFNVKGFKLLPIFLTRNDTRKIILFVLSYFSFVGILVYFYLLYSLALVNNFFTIYKRFKEGKK